MFYQVVMAFDEETEKGTKTRKEAYLVEDLDPTAATAQAVDDFGTNETFRVVSVAETKIKDVSLERNRDKK
jgi:hypothetical protein